MENSKRPDRGSGTPQAIGSVIGELQFGQRQQASSAPTEREVMEAWERVAGERYRDCRISTFQATTDAQRDVVRGARLYASDLPTRLLNGECAVFIGPPGTGKDHLALGILRVAIEKHGDRVARINGPEWFGTVRDAMDEGGASEDSLLKNLVRPWFLLISDPVPPVGAVSSHQAQMIYRLVERRYMDQRPTLMTLNVESGREAEDRIGQACVDRMRERSYVFKCNWPSFRKPIEVFG